MRIVYHRLTSAGQALRQAARFTNYKGYPNIGGGIEYWTPDKVRINVYRVRRLE